MVTNANGTLHGADVGSRPGTLDHQSDKFNEISSQVVVALEAEAQAREVSESLTTHANDVIAVHSLKDAATVLLARRPDVLVLHASFADGDGIEWLLRTRTSLNKTRIVVIGPIEREADALGAGADVCVIPPHTPERMALHAKQQLHNVRQPQTCQAVVIDVMKRAISTSDSMTFFTPTEMRLLLILAEARGMPVARRTLVNLLNHQRALKTGAINQHMSRIRQKLNVGKAGTIFGVRGGYAWLVSQPVTILNGTENRSSSHND